MPNDEKPGLAFLSLDGGRWENHSALTQIHVVEDILHKYEIDNNLKEGSARVSNVFDLVVGTGIGGLVGCMLGPLKMSTKDAKQAYLRIHASNFLAKDQLSERAKILKGALKRMLDSGTAISSTTKMASVKKFTQTCRFAVTAMMAANLSTPVLLRGYPGRSSPVQCTLLEALLATLSDAQVLPPVLIGESITEYFVATTTGRCNPTEALLEEIPSMFKSNSISVIISIGSGRPGPVFLRSRGDFANAVLNLAKSCHTVSQSMESRFSAHPGLYVRLDVEGLDHAWTLQPGEVVSHSRAYLAKEQVRADLNALIHSLKYRPKRLVTRHVSGLRPGILERIDNTLNAVLSAEDNRILAKLNISTDAPFTSFLSGDVQRQSCTPGTRIAILQRLLDWATLLEPELKNSLFWLYGLAGTGKTTILRDICERLQKLDVLASSYFCSIQLSSGDVRHLVPTIARHLASRSPAFRVALVSRLQRNPDLFFADLAPQFEYLLCKPWKTAARENHGCATNVVIIDALDECDRGEEFLSLLLDAIDDSKLDGVQFIVSSRPVPHLLKKVRELRPDSPQVSLHEVPKEEVNGDIKRYLEANLVLPSLQIDELVVRADGLFIYASTLVKYLLPSRPLAPLELERRLKKTLAQKPEKISINSLYKEIVEVALSIGDEEATRGRWSILHAILCAAEPPSAAAIAELLGVDLHIVTAVVDSLYSVLFITGAGGPICIFHASFHDFIVSSIDVEFRCHPDRTHSVLARSCLTEMTRSLRFNICHLESSFVPDADLDPPLAERIVRHCDKKSQSNHLPQLERVLEAKGIFWMEVMSLLGDIRRCKEVLMELMSLIIRISPTLFNLASQAVKLISLFDTLPVKITSHLYLSSLALAEGAPIDDHWSCQFLALPRVTSQQLTINRYCQVVIQVGASVRTIALSPDGKHIVSGSDDTTVRIWDAESGKRLHTLVGHTQSVNSIVFSPDGKRIVSGSEDRTVRIWNAESGKQLRTLDGHTDAVESVALSPDGKRIVSGSSDSTVRIWDAESGKHLRTLGGHTGYVWSVSFSPDGKRIVSGSQDSTVRIWDAESGKHLRTLNRHTDSVGSVAFSPNGKRIVSGSKDGTVRIWNAESGKQLGTLDGHTDFVGSVTFSPDGKRIVSGSYDRTVRIWNAESGKHLRTLDGHTDAVESVTFSPDGKRIVSGSSDSTVRIWDAEAGKHLRTLDGHATYVEAVSFSPDGKYIVSGSQDSTVHIWDAESGKHLRTLDGHTGYVWSASFSPDGRRIISGSYGKSGYIWNISSVTQLGTLDGHTGPVGCVAFSSDGKRIVSGSYDSTVRIWNAESVKQLRKLDGHTSVVKSVAFSPDGKRIVSGSHDGTIRIWDAELGKQLGKLDGHARTLQSVAFSPDIKRVTPAGYHSTVKRPMRRGFVEIFTKERMARLFPSKISRSCMNPPSSSNIPLVPGPKRQFPVPANTLIISQTSSSLHCRDDGWLVTSKEETGEELLILWIPPFRRPFDPSILLVISREGFNSIDLAGCVFGEGWEQCYTGGSETRLSSLQRRDSEEWVITGYD
ncbi:WD40-repeat-containing domain protein [Flagelloscypha sp. PMI_526]|nr:WD40-repeat-containing domain protein [Flagelloscypha sp. PMI_526]